PLSRVSARRRRPASGSRQYIAAAPAANTVAAFISPFMRGTSVAGWRAMLPTRGTSPREDSTGASVVVAEHRDQVAHELALRRGQGQVGVDHHPVLHVQRFPDAACLAQPATAVLQLVR